VVTDEFIGDDANHNRGAFFYWIILNLMNYFGKERNGPVAEITVLKCLNLKHPICGKFFFLNLGLIKNTQSAGILITAFKIWK